MYNSPEFYQSLWKRSVNPSGDSVFMHQFIVCLMCMIVLIQSSSCSSGLEASSQSSSEIQGAHIVVPKHGTRAVLWAPHPSQGSMVAYGAAMPWLQKRGFTLVERSYLNLVLREQKVRLTNTSEDEADLLQVGRLVGAEQIIFVHYAIGAVAVRGVNIQTGEVVWSGTAPIALGGDISKGTRDALTAAIGEQ